MPDTPVSTHAAFDDDPERLRETLDSLLEGVQILSRDWRYVYVNRAVAAHGRKSPEDLLGKTLFECYAGIESTRAFAELERCMQERRPSRIENEFEYEDGDRRWFELRIHPCREGLIVLSLDISERKQLEASLRQSQHLKALGQFAAGIAHDLKNFLTPISLQVSILQSLVDQDAEVRQTLAYIDSILKRGDETIQVLQDFARQAPERHRLEQVQPDDVMRQARQLGLGGVEPGRFELQETLEAAVPVRVRPAELLSSLLNIISNAIEAMPDGGRIALSSGVTDTEVWLEIADSGCGMDADVRQRALEPFFSTKTRGNSGLGLAMVYAFVTRSGGRVELQSTPGEGTTVRLFLPRADDI